MIVKKVDIKRIAQNKDASLGVIYFDGQSQCGSVEDQKQEGKKVRGETRVTAGVYKLALRNEGGFNSRYKKRYAKKDKGNWHRGMLCVYNDDNWVLNCHDGKTFQYILIHIGNDDDDTDGCLLPNNVISFKTYSGSRSAEAYEKIYPILRDSIEKSPLIDEWGNQYIEIEYSDIEHGNYSV